MKIAFSNIIDYHLNWIISLFILFFSEDSAVFLEDIQFYIIPLLFRIIFCSLHFIFKFCQLFLIFKNNYFLLLHIAELNIF